MDAEKLNEPWKQAEEKYASGDYQEAHRLAIKMSELGEDPLISYELKPKGKKFLSQIWTNPGNCFDYLGRVVDALECYEMALKLNPLREILRFSPAGH